MGFEQRDLDYAMVPAGLFLMTSYHLWLLHRIIKHPSTTIIGINAHARRAWVETMMADNVKNGVLAVQTMRNNIMASTVLASTAITVCSVFGILVSNGAAQTAIVFGDRSAAGCSVKYSAILMCFFVAFMCSVQSVRYYAHVNILINLAPHKHFSGFSVDYVSRAFNRGGYFWSLGLRACYFSFPMFLWSLGPIPMLIGCCMLVLVLYFLDITAAHVQETFSPTPSDLLHVRVDEQRLIRDPITKPT